MTQFHIQDPNVQMPLLDSQDMMARWIGAKPGDIVEITRKSETAGSTPYYRLCVADVTL
jgi:DNA-directed RNA polymerase subunit H (RpoH/RPB5)